MTWKERKGKISFLYSVESTPRIILRSPSYARIYEKFIQFLYLIFMLSTQIFHSKSLNILFVIFSSPLLFFLLFLFHWALIYFDAAEPLELSYLLGIAVGCLAALLILMCWCIYAIRAKKCCFKSKLKGWQVKLEENCEIHSRKLIFCVFPALKFLLFFLRRSEQLQDS